MSNSKLVHICFLGAALLGMISCAHKKEMHTQSHHQGISDAAQFYGQPVSADYEKQLLAQRVFNFNYDSFDIEEAHMLPVYAHAKRIMGHPNIRVRIEGHTDERGSREYNVALGEKRAKAISNILMLKGVAQHQITIVSFGKEKPLCKVHNESAWAQNRRAEIVYEIE